MKRKIKMSLFCATFIMMSSVLGNTALAYNTNGYKISSPGSVSFSVSNATYSSKIETYAKKWNQCSELYLYSTSGYVMINAGVSGEDTGNYGTTYHYGNDSHSVMFYALWQSTTDNKKNETVVHEFGHALGLGHTQTANESISVMRALGFNGKAYPLADDIRGISAIY